LLCIASLVFDVFIYLSINSEGATKWTGNKGACSNLVVYRLINMSQHNHNGVNTSFHYRLNSVIAVGELFASVVAACCTVVNAALQIHVDDETPAAPGTSAAVAHAIERPLDELN